MTNSKIIALVFYVFLGFFISTDANATVKCTQSGGQVECTTTRPSYTMHRNGDVITVKVSSSRTIPLVMSLPNKRLGIDEITPLWIPEGTPIDPRNGYSPDNILYNAPTEYAPVCSGIGEDTCDSLFKNYVLGKTVTISKALATHGNKGCVMFITRIFNPENSHEEYVEWVSTSGLMCTAAPPPDCVGDDCDTGEGETPEPSLACNVKTNSINLAFGNMAMGDALNKTASSKINVNCNKAGAKLTMSLKGGGSSIDLSNGMTAALTADGKSLGSSISANKGDNNITISGTLKGTEKEGGFSGSGVLVTDYQ